MRIARKVSEKSRDKFESFLARFSALPRLREQPLVREDAHYLLECRKQHVQHLVTYVHSVQLAQAVVEASLCQAAIATANLESAKGAHGAAEPAWWRTRHAVSAHTQLGELFHLKEDLGETKNLYAQYPDRVKAMRALLNRYQAENRSVPKRQ